MCLNSVLRIYTHLISFNSILKNGGLYACFKALICIWIIAPPVIDPSCRCYERHVQANGAGFVNFFFFVHTG